MTSRGTGITSVRMVPVDTPGLEEDRAAGKPKVCNGNTCRLGEQAHVQYHEVVSTC